MCYRRNGHNENDNPYVTQPIMYKAIEKQKPVMEKYAAELISSGVVTTDDYKVHTHTHSANFYPNSDVTYLLKSSYMKSA